MTVTRFCATEILLLYMCFECDCSKILIYTWNGTIALCILNVNVAKSYVFRMPWLLCVLRMGLAVTKRYVCRLLVYMLCLGCGHMLCMCV